MSYVDTGRKAEASGGSIQSLNITLNSTVAGSLVVVGSSVYQNLSITPNSIVTDGGNTWTQSFSRVQTSGTERQEAALSYSVLTTGGNRTINIDPNVSTDSFDIAGFAHEFSGPAATPASGTSVTNVGTTQTTSDTTSFTPADADCLFVAVDGNSASGTITENVAPGDTNWTLSNKLESGASGEPGSMVFFIQSGGPTARRAAWTIPTGTFWAAGIAGFKPVGTSVGVQSILLSPIIAA